MIFNGFYNQWSNKVIFVGGLELELDGFQFDIALDEMSCQNGSCAWANVGVSLATPRHHGIVIVVPELMACQAESGEKIQQTKDSHYEKLGLSTKQKQYKNVGSKLYYCCKP